MRDYTSLREYMLTHRNCIRRRRRRVGWPDIVTQLEASQASTEITYRYVAKPWMNPVITRIFHTAVDPLAQKLKTQKYGSRTVIRRRLPSQGALSTSEPVPGLPINFYQNFQI